MTLSKDEKERLVIDLYKKDKTRPEIARIVKMSFKRIQTIIHGYEDSLPSTLQSESSQALNLFSKGLKPLSVAIQLGIPPATAESYYLDYMRLVGLSSFANIYNEVGESLGDFISFYREVRSRNITIDNVNEALSASIRLPGILEQLARSSAELRQTQFCLLQIREALPQLNAQYEVSRQLAQSQAARLQHLTLQVEIMNEKHSHLNSVIERLKKDTDYQEFRQITEREAASVIKNRDLIIEITVAAVVKALQEEEIPTSQPYVHLHTGDLTDRLVKSASLILDEILTGVSDRILDRVIECLSTPIPTTRSQPQSQVTDWDRTELQRILKSRGLDNSNKI
jgi:hypothetical protein